MTDCLSIGHLKGHPLSLSPYSAQPCSECLVGQSPSSVNDFRPVGWQHFCQHRLEWGSSVGDAAICPSKVPCVVPSWCGTANEGGSLFSLFLCPLLSSLDLIKETVDQVKWVRPLSDSMDTSKCDVQSSPYSFYSKSSKTKQLLCVKKRQ